MQLMIGSVLVAAVVLLLLLVAVRPAALAQMKDQRGTAYMLLVGVPALVVQTDIVAIAALAGGAMAVFEIALLSF